MRTPTPFSAFSDVVLALAANRIDPRRAQVLIYGLQVASQNHRHRVAQAAKEEVPAQTVREIHELRRHLERVTAQLRALPQGGEISQDFDLVSEARPIHFSDLFGDKDTLLVYSMMFAPQRKAPCLSAAVR